MTKHEDADIFRVLKRLAIEHMQKVEPWWFSEELQDKATKQNTARAFPWRK
jgi:hypothetical protein